MSTAENYSRTEIPGKLHDCLTGMAVGLEQLYDCLRSQQAALLGWKLEAFLATVRQQKNLAEANLARENERRELAALLTGNRESAAASLRAIAEDLGQPWLGRFERLAERLRTAGGKVADMRKQNVRLIDNARNLVNDQLKLLLELARLNRNLYEGSGKKSRNANLHKVLDRKV